MTMLKSIKSYKIKRQLPKNPKNLHEIKRFFRTYSLKQYYSQEHSGTTMTGQSHGVMGFACKGLNLVLKCLQIDLLVPTQLSFLSFCPLLHHLGLGLNFFSETQFLRQKPRVPLRLHLTAVAPGLAPQTFNVPFHRLWGVPARKVHFLYDSLFHGVTLFGLECHANSLHTWWKDSGAENLNQWGLFISEHQ